MNRIIFAFLIILMTTQFSFAEEANESIPIGERLVYKISWLKIPVGTGELWAKEKIKLNGRDVIHVVGKIETNKVLSKIFPMHDEAHSWIDAETLESVQFEKKINELMIKTHERVTFDSKKGKGYFESLKTGEKKEFDITPPIHDVLSVIYWIRRQKLEPGKSIKGSLIADQKVWALDVKVVKKEKVKTAGKKVETLRIDPDTVVEGFERRGLARFNLTNDDKKIPVRGTYKAIFGRVVGILATQEAV